MLALHKYQQTPSKGTLLPQKYYYAKFPWTCSFDTKKEIKKYNRSVDLEFYDNVYLVSKKLKEHRDSKASRLVWMLVLEKLIANYVEQKVTCELDFKLQSLLSNKALNNVYRPNRR